MEENKSRKRAELRQKAEAKLEKTVDALKELPAEKKKDIQSLLHELQVHAIELELQNDELMNKQNELQLLEEQFKHLFDFAPVGYLILDEEGVILQANLTICEQLGIERSKILKEKIYSFIYDDYKDYLFKNLRKLFHEGNVDNFEIDLVDSRGLQKSVLIDITLIENKDGSKPECRIALSDNSKLKEIERTKSEFEKRFKLITEMSTDFTYEYNVLNSNQPKLLWISGAFQKITGFSAEELKKRDSWTNLIHPEDHNSVLSERKKILSGEERELEYRIVPKDGSVKWIREYIKPLFEEGKVCRIVGAVEDITSEKEKTIELENNYEANLNLIEDLTDEIEERKKVEKELKESEEKYRSLFENQIESFAYHEIILDKKGKPCDYKFIDVNEQFLAQTGLKDKGEIIGKTVLEKWPDTEKYWINTYGKVAVTGEPVTFENYSNVHDKYYLVNSYSPKEKFFATSFLDITDRKQFEEEIKVNLAKYKTLFDTMPAGITVTDNSGKIVESNLIAEKLLGLGKADHEKRKIDGEEWKIIRLDGSLMPSDEFASVRALKENVTINNVEMGIEKSNDEITWISVTAAPIPLENYGVVIIYFDITDRINAEKALRESEEKYKTLVESAPDAIAIHIDGKLVFVNPAALKLMEAKSKPQLIGKSISKFIHPDNFEEVKNRVQRILKGEEKYYTLEEKYITLKGKTIDVEVTASPIKFQDQIALQVIIRDVSERKRAQTRIIQERNRAQRYLESAGIMMLVLNSAGKITMINRKGAELLGYSKKYIIGKNWFDYFLPAEEAKTVKRFFKRAVSGELVSLEYYQNQVKCRKNKLKIVGWYNNFIKDENGRVKEVISSGEDITESIKLKTDLENSNAKLTDLTKHMDKVREEERLHLAREIHDDLGQSLTALKLDLTAAKNISDDKEQVNEIISDAISLTSDTIKSVQQMTSELRPTMIDDLGLIPTIEWYAKQFSERAKLRYHAKIDVNEDEIAESNKIIIYRIIQESLTNIARHAKASKFGISYVKKDKINILTIDDDGIGIDDDAAIRFNSHGLIGMQERARAIGAELEIRRRKTKGTRVRLSIPLSSK